MSSSAPASGQRRLDALDRVRTAARRWWIEAPALLLADQAFEWLRSRLPGSVTTAERHARSIVSLERWTGTCQEHRLQQWVLPHHFLLELIDAYYGTVHFVVPPAVLIWLWRRFPSDYSRWRNTLVIATLLGLAGFALYPLAPPRLLPASFGFTDTMRSIGGLGPLDSGRFRDTNAIAAMPSLHMAWSTWCACAVASLSVRRWVKVAAFIYPAVTLFVVMATANHFFLDAVGGWIVLALAWWLSGVLAGGSAGAPRGVRSDRHPIP